MRNPPPPFQGRPGHAIRAAQSALYALPDPGAVLAAIRGACSELSNHAESDAESDRLRAIVAAIDATGGVQ